MEKHRLRKLLYDPTYIHNNNFLKPHKLIEKKRSDLQFPEAEGWGRRHWRKVVKRYKHPVISTRDIMYTMMTRANIAV